MMHVCREWFILLYMFSTHFLWLTATGEAHSENHFILKLINMPICEVRPHRWKGSKNNEISTYYLSNWLRLLWVILGVRYLTHQSFIDVTAVRQIINPWLQSAAATARQAYSNYFCQFPTPTYLWSVAYFNHQIQKLVITINIHHLGN